MTFAPALRRLIAGLAAAAAVAPAAHAQPGGAASRIIVDSLWSRGLGTWKRFRVYIPAGYDGSTKRFAVAYYLHGLWGSEQDWLNQGRLGVTLDSLTAAGVPPMLVVMPDGDDSWYTTWNHLGNGPACQADTTRKEPAATYCVPWPKYDDYIARELVAAIDARYRTHARRESRGIAGLSMGGYGAITLALAYPDVFAAAASHSGVVWPLHADTSSAPLDAATGWDRRQRFYGALLPSITLAMGRDTLGWRSREPLRLARLARVRGRTLPALWIDCGVGDKYIGQNRRLHAALDAERIPHVWNERPGAHSWVYWRDNAAHSLTWLSRTLVL